LRAPRRDDLLYLGRPADGGPGRLRDGALAGAHCRRASGRDALPAAATPDRRPEHDVLIPGRATGPPGLPRPVARAMLCGCETRFTADRTGAASSSRESAHDL